MKTKTIWYYVSIKSSVLKKNKVVYYLFRAVSGTNPKKKMTGVKWSANF